MASDIQICNLALRHLGQTEEIAEFDEKSLAAETCKRFYEPIRNEMLRDHFWSFAGKIDTLALVETNPNDEWGFSYRYPSDCLKVRRILSGLRNDSSQTKVPYKIISDDEGRLILTDYSDAQLEYTFLAEDTEQYPEDFKNALAWRLAVEIAPSITAGDPDSLGKNAMQMALYYGQKAKANDINEQKEDQPPDSEFITARS